MAMSLGCRTVERPADVGWTVVGTLDGAHPARVDGGGLINPAGAGWSLDWWIGADDRWYLPAREPTVRQRRLGAGPILETTVRIPSGDARQVVYGAMVQGREMTVVEVHNESPVPVALALAVRPFDVAGRSSPTPAVIELDQRVVRVDSRQALLLPRPPNEAAGSTATDLVDTVRAGESLGWTAGAGTCDGIGANAVVLYPLPHRTSLRFLVPADPAAAGTDPIDPASAPDADAVARGWASLLAAAGGVELPDSGLTGLVGGARARLLLAAVELPGRVVELRTGTGLILHGLASGGHRSELGPSLDALANAFPTRLDHGAQAAAEVVAALGPALEALGRRPRPELLEVAAQLTHLVERSKEPAPMVTAKRGLARLARLAGDERAAARLEDGLPEPSRPGIAEIMAAAEAASPAGSWSVAAPGGPDGGAAVSAGSWSVARPGGPYGGAAVSGDDPAIAARFLLAARALLIDDSGAELLLLPRFPTAWRGGNVEVHRLPTSHGEVSFGIRWHGARPALLWELDGASAVIRCPGLDPDWSTGNERGEALLAGSADGLVTAPGPGDSFS